MIYRVVLNVSYYKAYFDFKNADRACNFASIALEHSATSKDQDKLTKISIVVVNPNEEDEEE